MRYTTFGPRSGLRVSELALGTANFGTGCGADPDAAKLVWGRRGDGAARDEARLAFDRFAEAGGNFIDTADCYQFGESERLVGEFVAADRDHFVVSTKFTNGISPRPRVSTTGNSRKTMVRALEASLDRLGTDYVDVYWVHFPDHLTPVEEILAGFDDLVRAGKILYAGLSNFSAWRVSRAVTMAELRGWSPLIGVQGDYSLVARTADRELLPMAEALGLGVGMWAPLGGGLLTGAYRRTSEGWVSDRNRRAISTPDDDRTERILRTLGEIADAHGVTPARIALAWVCGRAARSSTSLVPIIGPRTESQTLEYLAALDIDLGDDEMARLDRASAISLGAPHELGEIVKDAVLGGEPTLARSQPVA